MIYDCFIFFDELDLLEIRLNVLNDSVDKFVLVEATKTHHGKDKPLHFLENIARYSKFRDKIIHVVVDRYPDYHGKQTWVLENYQRNMIMNGLKNCNANDVIMISDLDEIPNPEKISKYKSKPGIKIFKQKSFYYFINCINVTNAGRYKWTGTAMVNYSDLTTPQDLRKVVIQMRDYYPERFLHRMRVKLWKFINIDLKGKRLFCVDNGGWHFSYLGGVNSIIKKLEAFAHTEYDKKEFKDTNSIEFAINNGQDIFGRNFSYKFVALDDSFPKFILMNKNNYSHLIKTL